MTSSSVTSLILDHMQDYGLGVLAVLGSFLVLALGYLIFCIGKYWLAGLSGSGTTSRLGQHFPMYDRLTYRPYKGYNRLRSRQWNMEHTA